jgi:anthranilate synthase component 1
MSKVQYTLQQVTALSANHRVIPIVETLFSGSETPLSIFEKLAAATTGGFLLESAQHGVWDRYSFIGVQSRGMLIKEDDQSIRWESSESALPNATEKLPTDALAAVAKIQSAWNSPTIEGLPPLTSGLVGVMGWDLIHEIEPGLAASKPKDYAAPTLALGMFRDLVIVDHDTSSLLLVSNLFIEDNADIAVLYQRAISNIDEMRTRLLEPSEAMLAELDFATEIQSASRTAKQDYLDAVDLAKNYVRAGDVFQVVISQRFETSATASPLDIYRVLRSLNPSPYMYLLNYSDSHGDFSVVGSSPEALVTVNDSHAVMHPIAGSRPRGKDVDADTAIEQDLLSDAKEKAEHLMLVDLARNDLLKVCEPTTVAVSEFMKVHKFSHIMHLVSTVEGTVAAGKSAVDVFRATFPAGTLSGAPKPRALEIIHDLEPSNRGIFGGVVGYFDFANNANLAIAIRTAFIRDSKAYVQAGAGVVLDSNSESEFAETVTKATATLRAVAAANAMKRHLA